MEEEKKQGVLEKIVREHPLLTVISIALFFNFVKDMTEIFVNRKKGE